LKTHATLCVMQAPPREAQITSSPKDWLGQFLHACARANESPHVDHWQWVVIDPQPWHGRALQQALADVEALHTAPSPLRQHAAAQMLAQWPPLTHNTHVLTWLMPRSAGGQARVTLHLIVAPVVTALRQVLGSFDRVWWLADLPATPAPRPNDPSAWKSLGRLCKPQAHLTLQGPPPWLEEAAQALPKVGFVLAPSSGAASLSLGAARPLSREALPWPSAGTEALQAHFAPRAPAVDRLARLGNTPTPPQHVVVLGAGLSGAHVARALAHRGIACTVMDREPASAMQGSGGSAGIFHGTVHTSDGPHARLFRAASLQAAVWHREALAAGVEGAANGLLRWSADKPNTLQERLHQQHMPCDWVHIATPTYAQALAQVMVPHAAAWHFPSGGWINPRALVAWCLQRPLINFLGGQHVHAIARRDDRWMLLDAHGFAITSATHLVLADAQDAARLCPHAAWPLATTRGQSTQWPAGTPGLVAPRMAVSGHGYALTAADGSVHVGASATPDDDDATPRSVDTVDNLRRLTTLTGSAVNVALAATGTPMHRVGWRAGTPDKLPIVGAVPRVTVTGDDDIQPPSSRATHHAHQVPREAGLYVLSGLGSRGLTLAPLMAQVVVACMLREPVPLEADLLDVVDAARFVAKRARVAAG
jgi:tRNA 5-methylaminomethyl-2-thiouridine biosynthesis bifunctional protein